MAVYVICYLASYILARFGHYLISGLLCFWQQPDGFTWRITGNIRT